MTVASFGLIWCEADTAAKRSPSFNPPLVPLFLKFVILNWYSVLSRLTTASATGSLGLPRVAGMLSTNAPPVMTTRVTAGRWFLFGFGAMSILLVEWLRDDRR